MLTSKSCRRMLGSLLQVCARASSRDTSLASTAACSTLVLPKRSTCLAPKAANSCSASACAAVLCVPVLVQLCCGLVRCYQQQQAAGGLLLLAGWLCHGLHAYSAAVRGAGGRGSVVLPAAAGVPSWRLVAAPEGSACGSTDIRRHLKLTECGETGRLSLHAGLTVCFLWCASGLHVGN